MESLGLIVDIGPASSRPMQRGGSDFIIEVELHDERRAFLELSRPAAHGLAKELADYMQGRGRVL